MNSIQKLTEMFSQFPGIGQRQAKRFVYYLLTKDISYLEDFSHTVIELKKDIRICQSCFRFFQKNTNDIKICDICSNPNRADSSLMIVSRDVDLENIEKTHVFNGKYFVLGGSIPILEKNPEQRIRIKELQIIICERGSHSELREIILAVNATPEGENTAEYVQSSISQQTSEYTIKISHLGKGISTGTELEYSDTETLKNALNNRQ